MTTSSSFSTKRIIFVAFLIALSVLAVLSYLKLVPWHRWLVSQTSVEVAVIYFVIAGLAAFIFPFLPTKYFYSPFIIGIILLMSFWGVASDKVPGVSSIAGPILFLWLLFGDIFLTSVKNKK